MTVVTPSNWAGLVMGITFVVCSNNPLKFGMNEIQVKKIWPHTIEHVHVSFATIIALLTLVTLLLITDKVKIPILLKWKYIEDKNCHFGCKKWK